jgi:hypothetical protein
LKRSTLLVVESIIIASLLLGIAVGGTLSSQTLPGSWFNAKNPNVAIQQYNVTSVAKAYNGILTDLGKRQFGNVSILLDRLAYASYPSSILSAASSANAEIASMNVSMPLAANDLTQAFLEIENGQFGNTGAVTGGCAQIAEANNSLIQFTNFTTPTLASLGVPVSIYTPQLAPIKTALQNLRAECVLYLGFFTNFILPQNAHGVNFTISPDTTSVISGGNITFSGSLTVNGSNTISAPISVSFYMNGTLIGMVNSTSADTFVANLNITSVYKPLVLVWAVTRFQTTKLFVAVSQKLNISVNYTSTQITLGS